MRNILVHLLLSRLTKFSFAVLTNSNFALLSSASSTRINKATTTSLYSSLSTFSTTMSSLPLASVSEIDLRNAIEVLADGTGGWLQHRTDVTIKGSGPGNDWLSDILPDLQDSINFKPTRANIHTPPKILVLYGSLRMPKSFSRFLALECARILELMGAEVRVYDPHSLPVRDPSIEDHVKVKELRELVLWSEGHIWCAPELHGGLCGTFKNQIDWIPLDTGSVRPTQGKSVAVLQVNGGSQSFNTVNALRLLARWMRMPCSVNQSSVPIAWKEFDDDGRMKESSYRERVVDVLEEYFKFHLINREYSNILTDRYSERKEKKEKGKLLTQAEKEAEKDKATKTTTSTETTTTSTEKSN